MSLNFEQMSRPELRAYVLAHRDDEVALQLYLDRISANATGPSFPAPKSIED
jgi:hypothetical protein